MPNRAATVTRMPRTRPALASLPAAIPFGLTIGLSAFLLFSVEPLVGRLVLPVFGGAAGVWATVLAFFQAVLLLGYLYAHLVATRLSVRAGVVLHLGLAAAATVATIAAPARLVDVQLGGLPTLVGLMVLLTLTIGPAAFVLTSTTPLMSTWYARVRRAADPDASAADPYWLYALSNGASLIALLAYPFVLEPNIGLTAQRETWAIGFGLLMVALVVAALRYLASVAPAAQVATPAGETMPGRRSTELDRRRRARWLLLSAVPAGLLSAVTNFVTTDLISAPLLWVIPLAVYLASFVVAFSARGRARVVPMALTFAPAMATLMWVPLGSAAGWPIVPLLAIEYVGLAVLAVALHGRLAGDRPAPGHLTDFYLTMSLGGALGGTFVAVVAPIAFDGVWEYPLLIVGALAGLALTSPRDASLPTRTRRPSARLVSGIRARMLPYALAAAGLIAIMANDQALAFEAGIRWLLVGGLVLLVGGVPWFLVVTTGLVLVLATFVLPQAALFRDRSFFGVVGVYRDRDATTLLHGTTVHGQQWLDPARRNDPSSYYARSGPIGDLFAAFDEAHPTGGAIRVAGLGAGSLAAFTRAGDRMVFYEIDPIVAEVAANTRYFTYLADAPGAIEVRIGDGRLLLGREPDGTLDLVILDAFSSDSIPIHLITEEALADAARALRPDGLLVVHVSNRYYDLGPVVAASADRLGLAILERQYAPAPEDQAAGAGISHWMVLGRSAGQLAPFVDRGWLRPGVADQPFTDDFADLLHHLRPGAW
jgi:SAM-dependent methyltransferase